MRYILATHTGKSFYTNVDRTKMPNFSFFDGLAIVDGDCQEWINRVGGKEITEVEAETIIRTKLEEARGQEILKVTSELEALKAQEFTNILLK